MAKTAKKPTKPKNVVAEVRSGGKKTSQPFGKWLWENFKSLAGAVAMLNMEGCLGLSESGSGSDSSLPRFSSAILESCGRETAYGGIRTSDPAILIAGSYGVNYSTLFLEKISDKGERLWLRKIDSLITDLHLFLPGTRNGSS